MIQLDSGKGTSATKVESYTGSGVKRLQDYLLLLRVQIQMQLQTEKQIFEMSKAVKQGGFPKLHRQTVCCYFLILAVRNSTCQRLTTLTQPIQHFFPIPTGLLSFPKVNTGLLEQTTRESGTGFLKR